MRLLFGLGNPGSRYEASRHNVGFRVLDALRARLKRPPWKKHADAWVSGSSQRGRAPEFLLIKPASYVNASGSVVKHFSDAHHVPLQDVLIVLDDCAIPLGQIRFRLSGRDGGHRGLASVLQALDTCAVPRLRVGVGFPAADAKDLSEFVLGPFTEGEDKVLSEVLKTCVQGCVAWLSGCSAQALMNRLNRRS